jgi:hypothetical protein
MVDLLERIGPYLGIAAFLGLAILAFLIFQQARDVRRLRDWAGRAPERAAGAAEAVAAAAQARGESPAKEAEEAPASTGRIATWWRGVRGAVERRWAALDRRLPIHPRYLLAVAAAALVAAGVLTSGFGLLGGGDDGAAKPKHGGGQKQEKVEVAVLNGTQEQSASGPIAGVQGLAGEVADRVVKPAGYKAGKETDAASGLDETTIFFEPGEEAAADELAKAVADKLGETPVTPMIEEVRDLAGGASLALVIGHDDAEF